MGRKRNKENEKLPPYVYRAKGRYEYRRYSEDKKSYRTVGLCGVDASMAEVWTAYERAMGRPRDNFQWLGGKYMASPEFRSKARRTREEREKMLPRVSGRQMRSGISFGALQLDSITPVVMRRYMDKFGPGREVSANRELAFMSVVFAWGYERGFCKMNPCRGVRKFSENPKRVYARDEDYKLVYDLAMENARRIPYIPIAMEISYLCRARRVEVLGLIESDVTPEGLLIRRHKGSKTQVAGWTPRLRAAVDAALALPGVAHLVPEKKWLIHDKHGNRILDAAFRTSWRRLMAQAVEKGLKQRFTFHDLKRKGVSDFDGDKLKASGHRSPKMLEVYDVSIEVVEATK